VKYYPDMSLVGFVAHEIPYSIKRTNMFSASEAAKESSRISTSRKKGSKNDTNYQLSEVFGSVSGYQQNPWGGHTKRCLK